MPMIFIFFEMQYLHCDIEMIVVTTNNGCTKIKTTNVGVDPSFTITTDFDIPQGTTVTWDATTGNQKVNGYIIVRPQAILYINDITVQFNENSGIKVEEGGKLFVYKSTLTNIASCNKMWKGIYVFGNPIMAQPSNPDLSNNPQGVVGIYSSTIEHAHTGITAGYPGQPKAGGMVYVQEGSEFKNNRIGIYFDLYNNTNKSIIENNTFINDEALPDPVYAGTGTTAFIHIVGGINTNFTKNLDNLTFINSFDGFPVTKRGTGINIVGSIAIGSIQNCFFNGLTYGIKGSIRGIAEKSSITDNNFKNVQKGIYLTNSSNLQIGKTALSFNTFTIPAPTLTGILNYTCGVQCVGGSSINVLYNNFNGTPNSHPTEPYSYGLLFETTGSNSSTAFQNTFRNTDFGLQTFGLNNGLKIRCNQFAVKTATGQSGKHNVAAWTSLKKQNATTGAWTGSLMMQGSNVCALDDTKAAGNKWLEPAGSTGEIDIRVNATDELRVDFKYFAHPLPYNSNVPFTIPSNSTLIWFTTNVISNCLIESNNSCSSNTFLLNAGAKSQSYADNLTHLIDSMAAQKASLQLIIDNGNQQTFMNAIHNNQPPGTILNLLMAASPYLSDRVLIAAISEKPTALPAGHIKQILIANSPLSYAVKQVFASCILPNGIRQQIMNAQTGTSQRFMTESNINRLGAEVQEMEKALAEYYISIGNNTEALAVMQESAEPEIQMQLAEIYLAIGNIAGSRNILTELLLNANATNLEEIQNYCNLMTVELDLQEAGLSLNNINSAQEQEIRDVAASGTTAAVQAEVMLTLIYGEEFDHPPVVDEPSNLRSIAAFNLFDSNNEPNLNDVFAKIYPNPNDGNMMLKYSIPENQTGLLCIYDIFGRKLIEYTLDNSKNTLPLSFIQITSGLYFYKVFASDILINEEKLIIFK